MMPLPPPAAFRGSPACGVLFPPVYAVGLINKSYVLALTPAYKGWALCPLHTHIPQLWVLLFDTVSRSLALLFPPLCNFCIRQSLLCSMHPLQILSQPLVSQGSYVVICLLMKCEHHKGADSDMLLFSCAWD